MIDLSLLYGLSFLSLIPQAVYKLLFVHEGYFIFKFWFSLPVLTRARQLQNVLLLVFLHSFFGTSCQRYLYFSQELKQRYLRRYYSRSVVHHVMACPAPGSSGRKLFEGKTKKAKTSSTNIVSSPSQLLHFRRRRNLFNIRFFDFVILKVVGNKKMGYFCVWRMQKIYLIVSLRAHPCRIFFVLFYF